MVYLDENPSVIAWSSEEIVIPYISPKDGRQHRYFVDFYLKVKKPDDTIKEYLWEVKPHKETIPPVAKTRTEVLAETKGNRRKYYLDVIKYGINNAKWEAARAYCESRDWTFQTVTEKHLASMVGLKK